MSTWPTLNSISTKGPQFSIFSTPGSLLITRIVIFVIIFIGLSHSLQENLHKTLSNIISILVALCASYLLGKVTIPCEEVEDIRVLEVEPGMVLCTKNLTKGTFEGGLVLSRLTISDLSPQVEIVIAGNQEPFIYPPDSVVQIIKPLDDSPHTSETMPDSILNAVEKRDINLLTENDKSIARNLGLIKRLPYSKKDKWSASAISYRNALEIQKYTSHREPPSSINIYVNFYSENVFEINGFEINLDDAIEKISNLISTDIQNSFLSKIEAGRDNRQPEKIHEGFLKLGKDIIIGALGSGAWAAISGM